MLCLATTLQNKAFLIEYVNIVLPTRMSKRRPPWQMIKCMETYRIELLMNSVPTFGNLSQKIVVLLSLSEAKRAKSAHVFLSRLLIFCSRLEASCNPRKTTCKVNHRLFALKYFNQLENNKVMIFAGKIWTILESCIISLPRIDRSNQYSQIVKFNLWKSWLSLATPKACNKKNWQALYHFCRSFRRSSNGTFWKFKNRVPLRSNNFSFISIMDLQFKEWNNFRNGPLRLKLAKGNNDRDWSMPASIAVRKRPNAVIHLNQECSKAKNNALWVWRSRVLTSMNVKPLSD